jgi:hypothetical protein
VTDPFKHGNEPSLSIKKRNFLSNWQNVRFWSAVLLRFRYLHSFLCCFLNRAMESVHCIIGSHPKPCSEVKIQPQEPTPSRVMFSAQRFSKHPCCHSWWQVKSYLNDLLFSEKLFLPSSRKIGILMYVISALILRKGTDGQTYTSRTVESCSWTITSCIILCQLV